MTPMPAEKPVQHLQPLRRSNLPQDPKHLRAASDSAPRASGPAEALHSMATRASRGGYRQALRPVVRH